VPTVLLDETLAAAQSGDMGAFNEIYAALGPAVLGYLNARGADDPEGAAQEVFLTVFTRLHTVRGGSEGLRTFAFSVAHARYVDELRRRARRPAVYGYDADLDGRTSESAESAALASLGGEAAQALDLLPVDQREVLTLRVIGDLSVEQVATIMKRSPGSVKQLQRRALTRLRAMLDRKDILAS
jgi:RNA polymerase sigma factor (sigma-70 family)